MRELAAAIVRTSTTPNAVSQTGRISVLPWSRSSRFSKSDIAASSARIWAALSLMG